jgi:PAS domain S-box-containing protein
VPKHPADELALGSRAARRLAAIVESSDDAIVSKDLNGIVTSWNRAAERMFGYSAAEMIGESIRIIIPNDRQDEEDKVLAHIRRGEKVDHFETIRRRKDGTFLPISLTVSPILDDNGTVVGVSKIARDITERRRAQEEHARLLALAQEHAETTEKLNQVGTRIASVLDRNAIVQAVVDAATEVTGAEFGAFFSNPLDTQRQDEYRLYASSPNNTTSEVPHLRLGALLGPIVRASGVLRVGDITNASEADVVAAMPRAQEGPLALRSYLAIAVKSPSGDGLGALLFTHSQPGAFTEQHERLVIGIAAWASLALENARLYVGAQEANRLKDEFLATLSHELRTPLNAILGYARMIKAGLVTGEKQTRAVETIERNATSLTQIVEDVLDVSRIISGKVRLNVQPVDVRQVVRNALDAVMPAANARGVRVDTNFDPRPAPVSGDAERLQQVVWNLLSNAVKFTGRNGHVQVRLERTDSHLEVVVSDTGIGIPPAFLPHVFERFRQADSGTTRERGGLGLGLAIARHFVEMHGGTIHASSGGENMGATFRIELPLMRGHAEPDADSGLRAEVELPERRLNMPDLKGIRVLTVDDDRDALRLVSEILEVAGADVISATSALDALELLERENPDVVLADLGLPRVDGFELVRRIRQHRDARVREVPAAALTAYARSEDRARALRSGFQIHLAKPIDPEELTATIAALVRRTDPGEAL